MQYGYGVQAVSSYDPYATRQGPSAAWVMFIVLWAAACVTGALLAAWADQVIIGILVAGLPTVFGVVAKPSFAMSCIAVMLPLGSALSYGAHLSGDRVIGAVAALGILANCLVVRNKLSAAGSPLLPIFLVACLGTLSILWATYPATAVIHAGTLLQLVLYNFAIWNAMAYGEGVLWPLRSYAAGTLLMGLWLLSTNSLAAYTRQDERLTIAISDTVNPADFAVLLGAAFFVSVYLLLRDPVKWLRPLWLVNAPLSIGLMIMTGSRGPLIGLVAGVGATLLSIRGGRSSKILLIGCFAMVVLVGGGGYMAAKSGLIKEATVERLVKSKKRGAAMDDRLQLAMLGLRTIAEKPFTGVGLANYRWSSAHGVVAHMDILHLGTELGVFAMIFYVWFLSKQAMGVLKTRSPYERWFLAMVTAFLAVSALGHVIFFRKVFHFFMITAAAMAYRARVAEQGQERQTTYPDSAWRGAATYAAPDPSAYSTLAGR